MSEHDVETMEQLDARIKYLEGEIARYSHEMKGKSGKDKLKAFHLWADYKTTLRWALDDKARLETAAKPLITGGIILDDRQFAAIWDGRSRAFLAQDHALIKPDEPVEISGEISGHSLRLRAVIAAVDRDCDGLMPAWVIVHIGQLSRLGPV